MKKNELNSFAEALFEIGVERNTLEKYYKETREIVKLFEENPRFEEYLLDPVIELEDKRNIVKEMTDDEMIHNFLMILIEGGKI